MCSVHNATPTITKTLNSVQVAVLCGYSLPCPLSRQEKPATSAPSPTYAGFGFRVLALVIDGVLCQIIAVIVVLPLAFALGASMAGTSSAMEIEAAGSGLGFFIGILVQWLWFTIPESSK